MKLSCKEMGVAGCDFVASGKTADEVKKKLNGHAMKAHADMLSSLPDAERQAMAKKMDEMLAKQK